MYRHIHWQDFKQLSRSELPDKVRPWLLDRGSLTARLIKASQGNFRVELIEQSWRLPTRGEAKVLGLKPRQPALIREVLLICNEKPWVYARSVIPEATLSGELGYLRKLRNSALGAILFKDPNLKRSRFEIARIKLPNTRIPIKAEGDVFGRRSLFELKGQKLLVAEIFLPDCQLDVKTGLSTRRQLRL